MSKFIYEITYKNEVSEKRKIIKEGRLKVTLKIKKKKQDG